MTVKVFVSSVIDGLEDYRSAVVEVANRMNLRGTDLAVIRVDKDYPALAMSSQRACRQGVEDAELTMAIIGTRYGWVDPVDDISASEAEFDHAAGLGRKVLAFVLEGELEERQRQFKDKVGEYHNGVLYRGVDSIGRFMYECHGALSEWYNTASPSPAAVASYSISLVQTIYDELPLVGRLSREETAVVLDLLERGSVALTGDKGVGKSGILKQIVNQLRSEGIPHLFIDPRVLPQSSTVVEEALGLGPDVVAELSRLGRASRMACLVVDDLGFSASSNLGKALLNLIVRAVGTPPLRALIAVRSYDVEQSGMSRLGAAGVHELAVSQLPTAQVEEIFAHVGLSHAPVSAIELGRNLLQLSIMLELHQNGIDIGSIPSTSELWERYLESIRDRDGAEAVEHAMDLAQSILRLGEDELVLDGAPSPLTERLVSAGILRSNPLGRVRFRHEELAHFLYAFRAVRLRMRFATIADELTISVARRVLPHMQNLYSRYDRKGSLALAEEILGGAP